MTIARPAVIAAFILTVAACDRAENETAVPATPTGEAASASSASAGSTNPSALSSATTPDGGAPASLANRTGELVNPDDLAMIFLYYDLAGLTPPIERWIEEDRDVRFGDASEKPARREALRAAFTAAQASVRGVGRLRLTVQSDLSEYDPTYGEFTVRALAPSSTFSYAAQSQRVTIRLANGQVAQRWPVSAAQAQSINDRVSYLRGTQVDVLLRITGVQPGTDGGSLTAEVVSYEVRDRDAGILGRLTVAR